MNRIRSWRCVLTPATLVVLGSVLSGCDSNEGPGSCAVIDVGHYFQTARFDVNAAINFRLEQQITTYETGDCEMPSADDDGVRILVTNLSSCHYDLDYSLSVFVGRIGWTTLGSIGVDGGRTVDTGKVVKRNDVTVDVAQIIATGTVTGSSCQ